MSNEMNALYIAGSSNEIELISGFMAAVREYGYSVTFDWTKSFGESDDVYSNGYLTACAQADLNAVREADIVWYVTPAEGSGRSEGSATELGAALALGKIVLVSGTITRHRIFPRLANLRFSSHAEALKALEAFAVIQRTT